jgi:sirohydrochlorin ferrochelatase
MTKTVIPPLLAIALFSTGTLVYAGGHTGDSAMAEDHSGHDMSQHSTEPDELGRRLFGMKHQMTPEISEELRQKIPLFEKYSDAEIGMSMLMMGSNYEWYLSDDSVKGDQGVLLLLHGFRDGDPLFKKEVEGFSSLFPTAMAPGMSMMMSTHIQLAIDDLEAAGAENIVVVPIVSTSHNTMMRQWEYIFGLQDEAPYGSVDRVNTNAKILFAQPPGDDPIVAEILVDHATEVSTDPSNEIIIIAAHGPSFENDNKLVLAELENLAKIMREDSDFAGVQALTLQDDAPPEIRDANVAKLRKMVEDATAAGSQVIVVTNLIGTRTIQSKLRKDLKGLDYKFSKKGIAEHPNFIKEWMGVAIREQFEDNAR